MAKKLNQPKPRHPEVCDGCVEGMDLPPRIVMVDGKSLLRHFFVCTFFTARRVTSAPTVESAKCKGKSLIPLAELVTP